MTLDRRQFIHGAAAAGGLAALGACSSPGRERTATGPTTTTGPAAGGPGAGPGTLVLVTFDGGNDAVNTVAPIGDPAYGRLRGPLALAPEDAHDVGEGFALHPSLTACKALWDAGRLAVVHGVGFPELDRSHFHCRDVWQSGDPHETATGWVGRWLDRAGDTPIDAVAVGRTLPLLVRGSARSAAVIGPGAFGLPGGPALRPAIEALTAADRSRSDLADAVARSNGDLLTAVDRLGPVLDRAAAPGADADDGADSPLGSQLQAVAALVEADLPTRVFTVTLGGFDTHAGQAPTHADLLAQFDGAIGPFLERLADRPVTVAVSSEFGRRVAPNASGGTDHGKAGVMLLAGTVRAGHLGDPPPLDRLDDGDLAVTTDFRSVLGGLAEGVLGMAATDLFGPDTRPLRVV